MPGPFSGSISRLGTLWPPSDSSPTPTPGPMRVYLSLCSDKCPYHYRPTVRGQAWALEQPPHWVRGL